MWFGLAPQPSRSPTWKHLKDVHPHQCTCSKHANKSSVLPSLQSPRKGKANGDDKVESPRYSSGTLRKHEVATKLPVSAPTSGSDSSVNGKLDATKTNAKSSPRRLVVPSLKLRTPRRMVRTLRGVNSIDTPSSSRTETATDKLNTYYDQDNNNITIYEDKQAEYRFATTTSGGNSSSDKAEATPVNDSDTTMPQYPVPPPSARSRRPSRKYGHSVTAMNVDAVHSNFVALCDEPACLFPSRPQPENLVGHTSSVCAVLAHDDRYLVSCSIDGSVKVWSRINFMCLHTLFGHDDTVSCVDLNTKWLVSGSHDKTLRLYSCLHSFKLLHICSGHTGHVTRVHLPSSLSSHILSCSDDTTMRLWNGDTGVCLAVLRGHTSRITSFLFFHGSRLCSGSAEGSICFWDVASDNQHEPHQQYRAIKSFRPHKSTIQCLASSASDDESWIFSASSDGSVQIFHAKTMEHCGCFDQLQSPIYTMLALSSGKLLCSTGDGRVVIYSDLPHGMHQSAAFSMTAFAKKELVLSRKWISSVQLRGDLLACSSEDLLYVVDLDKCHVLVVIETRHGFVNSLSWLQATRLLTAGQDNVIKIWNT